MSCREERHSLVKLRCRTTAAKNACLNIQKMPGIHIRRLGCQARGTERGRDGQEATWRRVRQKTGTQDWLHLACYESGVCQGSRAAWIKQIMLLHPCFNIQLCAPPGPDEGYFLLILCLFRKHIAWFTIIKLIKLVVEAESRWDIPASEQGY